YLANLNDVYILVTGANKNDPNVTATYQDIPAGTQVPRGTTITVEFTDYSAPLIMAAGVYISLLRRSGALFVLSAFALFLSALRQLGLAKGSPRV
ncbi:MAG: hypothetical protein IKL99_06450, partial [Oscillospiraceae bacterium]|nr:hypothetical protein [Oscillospiraceae bacterium]